MTDARLPERWLLDRRLNRASDPAHRTFINVLLYAVANRTDGVVDLADLDFIPHARPECVPELKRLGLVEVSGDRLTLVDFVRTQTSRAQLEASESAREAERAADRERKRRKREEARGEVSRGMSDRKSDRNPDQKHRQAGQAGRQDRQASLEVSRTQVENGRADLTADELEMLAELESERSAAGDPDA